jgi:outer membrane protein
MEGRKLIEVIGPGCPFCRTLYTERIKMLMEVRRYLLMGWVGVEALVLLFVWSVAAQAAEPLSMAQAEQAALVTNPRLQAAKLDAVAASQKTKAALGRHFGTVDLVGAYNHYERDRIVVPMAVELFSNPALGFDQLPWDRNQRHYGIVWEIPLLAGGNLYEGDKIARLSQKASEDTAIFTRNEIRYNVRASYRNALIFQHTLAAVKSYREALQKDMADTGKKVEIGTWPPVNASKIAFALESAKAQEENIRNQLNTTTATLAALMGREPPAEGYELSDIPEEPQPPAVQGNSLKASALGGRMDLMAVVEGTRIAEHKKRHALDAFGPQLALTGSYLKNDAPSMSDGLTTHEVSLLLKIPLWDGMQKVYALREADANLLASRQREKAKQLEVAQQVVDAQGRLNASKAAFDAGKTQRMLGAEVARVEHLKLMQGKGKMEDYLAARSGEMQGDAAYWQGLYSYQSAVDYLDFITARGGNHE